MINTAVAPWFNDYDPDKGFHQILFKPGFAVQARELTQIQSILSDQVSKFGTSIFTHGSVVLPGNSTSDLNICFVKLQNTTIDVTSLVGKIIVGVTTGLRALVRYAVVKTATEPATLYVSYYNSGNAGENLFIDAENLTVTTGSVVQDFYTIVSGACGGASMAFVNRGVFYVNGAFVGVNPQSVVMSNSITPSCHVLLKIVESVVDSDQDSSLLDPAQGSYNYAAPGADRLKIALELVVVPLGTTLTDDYIELMRYDQGVLLEHLRYPKYSELAKNLARRTYDESGDYVVSGLSSSVREHLKRDLNGGRYPAPTGDSSKLVYTVTNGKAYVQGFETEVFSSKELIVNKARDSSHLTSVSANINPTYGQYLYVTDIGQLPNFKQRELVTFYNSYSGGTVIGTARVIAIDYLEPNTTDTNAIFKLFINEVVLTGGNESGDIGRVTYTTGSSGVVHKLNVISYNTTNFALGEIVTSGSRTCVVHKYTRSTGELYVHKNVPGNDIPVVGDNLTAPSGANAKVTSSTTLGKNLSDILLIQLPTSPTYKVKNSLGVTDMSYKIYYETTLTVTGGAGSFSVTGMTIDPKEQGNFIIAYSGGIIPLSTATVAPDGLSVSFSGVTPASTTLHVICAATKTGANAAPKSKTLVTAFSQSGLTPGAIVQLTKADVIRVTSVVSTVDGNVTSRYRLDNGQQDYAYLRAGLIHVSGTIPTGTLTVVYDYFNHNAGSGDYFSIDSYELSGLDNYYESGILEYKSRNTGQSFDLRNVLDFRPREADEGGYVTASASLNYMVQVDSRITTSIQKYIGRVDSLVLNKNSKVMAITGTPSVVPKAPAIPSESIKLADVTIPAYTFNVTDVKVKSADNRGYTMRDIGSIEKRVASLEDYVLLNETESSVINYDVIDATTGLSRFKSGFLVDTFNNIDTIADVNNTAFRVAYVSESIVPMFEVIDTPLQLVTTTAQITNNVISLPYSHVVFAQQPLSSKITNINPFSVFSWKGDMTLVPNSDSWVEVQNLQAIINNQTETITETINIRRAWDWVAPGGTNATFAPAPIVVNTQPVSVGRKIICCELYAQGYLDDETFILDEAFGEILMKTNPDAIVGYHLWAKPVVALMKKSSLFTSLVWTIAKPWTKSMAHEMGFGVGSKLGDVMMRVGIGACAVIGKIVNKVK